MTIDFTDNFDRPDGLIGNGWTDVSTIQHEWTDVTASLVTRPGLGEDDVPKQYVSTTAMDLVVRPRILTPFEIIDERLTSTPRTPATNRVPETLKIKELWTGYELHSHSIAYREFGVTDDFEVSLDWVLPDSKAYIHQLCPVAFFDPEVEDPRLMGLMGCLDHSWGGWWNIQNVFRCPESQLHDIAPYLILGETNGLSRQPDGDWYTRERGEGGVNLVLDGVVAEHGYGWDTTVTLTLRARSGQVAMYVNGTRVVGPLDVPEEMQGIDGWGLQVLGTQGDPSFGNEGFESDAPAYIASFHAETFTGTL